MQRIVSRLLQYINKRKTWLLLLPVAISLVMAGFAHRAVSTSAADSPVSEARYVLPDGTPLDICLNGSSEDHRGSSCDFCRIASASHALDGLPVLEALRLNPASNLPRHSEAVPVLLADHCNPARAPPCT